MSRRLPLQCDPSDILAVGECVPTLFAVHAGQPDWKTPIILEKPGEYAEAAAKVGASAVVLVGSHTLIDPEHAESALIRLYAGLLNARGEVLVCGKQQRKAT